MHIFQIQIHPNKPGEEVEYAKNGLIRTGAIGLDFSEPRRRVIEDLGLDGIPIDRFSFSNDNCRAICAASDGMLAGSLIRFRDLETGDTARLIPAKEMS